MSALDQRIHELRPKLHRYCARMTGSVVDAEDIVQETILKALEAAANGVATVNPEGWLFRIAHNAALDFLRRNGREDRRHSREDLDIVIDPDATAERSQVAAASLQIFTRLPVGQRCSVVLMDVLGYSLQEISEITTMTVPAVKAAMHRGRARLREVMQEPDNRPAPTLTEPERMRLSRYVDCFNEHDFDAIRDMLAEEVQLEMVSAARLDGRNEVSRSYFHNYGRRCDWNLVAGWVDRRSVVLVYDPTHPMARPEYFIVLEWAENCIKGIRDFAHARYAIEGAEVLMVRGSP